MMKTKMINKSRVATITLAALLAAAMMGHMTAMPDAKGLFTIPRDDGRGSIKLTASEIQRASAALAAVVRRGAGPARLDALVRTSEVREAAAGTDGQVVMRLRLKLVEEGFEWTAGLGDDETSLVPE